MIFIFSLWFPPRSPLPALPHRLLAALESMGTFVPNGAGTRKGKRVGYLIENITLNPIADFLRHIFSHGENAHTC